MKLPSQHQRQKAAPSQKDHKKRAVTILRVSTKKQLDNESIGNQREVANAYCQSRGYERVDEFVIAETASKTEKRVTFGEALESIVRNKKHIDVVVIWKVDRFSRGGVFDYYYLKSALTKLGISLESATENIDGTPTGEALEGFLAVVARLDNRIRVERTISSERRMVDEGYWCREAITGFVNATKVIGSNDRGKPITRPTLAPTPDKKQWELLCYGLRKQLRGAPSKEIAEYLAKEGLLTREGNPMSPQTWLKICRNPRYGGLAYNWDRTEIIPAKHDGAITPDEWYQLQESLDKEGTPSLRLPRQRQNPDCPLRHFLQCSSCLSPLRGSGSFGKSRKKKYFNYDCNKSSCPYRLEHEKCFRVRAPIAHGLFLDFMKKIAPKPEVLDLFKEVVLDVWHKEYKELHRASAELSDKAEKLKANKAAILELMKTSMDMPELVADLKKQFATASRDLEKITALRNSKEGQEYDAATIVEACIAFLQNPSELWSKSLVQEQYRLQSLLFPDGLPFDVLEDKRTPKLSPVLEAISPSDGGKNTVAALSRDDSNFLDCTTK